MGEPKKITAPLSKEVAKSLKAGESVLISGTILCARDAAHKALTEALARGEKLPVDLKGETIYYLGPTPAKPGNAIGSAGPTTSGRMDKYTPTIIEQGIQGWLDDWQGLSQQGSYRFYGKARRGVYGGCGWRSGTDFKMYHKIRGFSLSRART